MAMLARGRGVAQRVVVAALLALGPACGDPPRPQDATSLKLPHVERPAEATRGTTRAFLGAATGALTITDAKATPLRAVAGAPLLADDKLVLGEDGLAVLIFTNGNVLRLEGPIEEQLQGLAGFDSKPVNEGLEAQLVAALGDRDRERLGASSERIGGWQLRLKALEAPAPELSEPAPAPDPAPELDGDSKESKAGDQPASMDAKGTPNAGYAGGGPAELVGVGDSNSDAPALGEVGDPRDHVDEDKKDAKSEVSDPNRATGTTPNKSSQAKPKAEPKTIPVPIPGASYEHLSGDEEVVPEATVVGSIHAPLVLRGRTWITSGAKVPLSADLSQRIAACLRPLPGTYVLVELSLSSGAITAISVAKHSSECIQDFIGETLAGVSESGDVRLTFERD